MESKLFKMKQKGYFDKSSKDYEDGVFFSRANRNHMKKIDVIMNNLNLKKGDMVLEIGAGTGIHAEALLEKKDIKYFGIDISVNMLGEAKKRIFKLQKDCHLVVGDAENLPFEDNIFDGVFCNATLHHLPDPSKGVSEMVRIVKQKGKIVIVEPNWMFPTNLLAGVLNSMERNVFKMNKDNLYKWARKERLKTISVDNFPIYTPPFPQKLIPIYDRIDAIFARIPFLSSFSILLFLVGEK